MGDHKTVDDNKLSNPETWVEEYGDYLFNFFRFVLFPETMSGFFGLFLVWEYKYRF